MTMEVKGLEQTNAHLLKLTGHVSDLAQAFYNKDFGASDDFGDEAEETVLPTEDLGMDKMGEDDPLGMGSDGSDSEDDMMPYDDESEDIYMSRMKSVFRATNKAKGVRKGFDNSATSASDEEDAKFGEADSNVPGNEPQPSGDNDGDSENESFGPGGEASRPAGAASGTYKGNSISRIAQLEKQVAELSGGQVIAKAIVPGATGSDARNPNGNTGQFTREMQEEAKGRSFRDLNRLREEVGDLPKNLF